MSASSRNLQQVIGGHEELDLLIKASGAGGGVNPHVHKSVRLRRSQQRTVVRDL